MTQQNLHAQLQALQKSESETLVRHLEIELQEPETKRAKSGRDVTYLNWQYRDPSSKDAEWKNRSTPIFSDEAKLLLAQGPYEQGQLYQVSAKKNETDYWQWNAIEKTELHQQRQNKGQANNGQQTNDPFDRTDQQQKRTQSLAR